MSITAIDVKNAVEQIPDTKFYSLSIRPKRVIVESANGGLYEIGFQYDTKSKHFSFNTAKPVVIKEPVEKQSAFNEEQKHEFYQNVDTVKNAIKQFFTEEYDVALADMKAIIRNLHSVPRPEETTPSTPVMESADEQAPARLIGESFADKIAAFEDIENEYVSALHIFTESGDIIPDKVISLDEQEAASDSAKAYYEAFKKCAELNYVFKKYLIETFGDDVQQKIFESADFNNKPAVAISKLAATLKREGHNINTVDFIKIMNEAIASYKEKQTEFLEDIDPQLSSAFIPNFIADPNMPKFLRFNVGIFTVQDLMTLSNELNQAIAHIGSITPEDLFLINNWKNQIEYMMRYDQICDRLVKEIIDTFNKRFGADKTADYENPEMSRGFRTVDQETINGASGFATHGNATTPSIPVDPNLAGMELVIDNSGDNDKEDNK